MDPSQNRTDGRKFCTHCLQWGLWENQCSHCRCDFKEAFSCSSCGLLYSSKDWQKEKCPFCSYTHPICFPNWYPSSPSSCLRQMEEYEKMAPSPSHLEKITGGIVPHAGWVYSGSLAAKTIRHLQSPDCVIVLGAVHRVHIEKPCILLGGMWETPLGKIKIDTRLGTLILKHFPEMMISEKIQRTEHSIEMEAPIIRYFFPHATLIPIMIPPLECAIDLGKACAEAVQEDGRKVAFLASTDLSHYGASFHYEPYGALPKAIEAVHQVDRQILDLMVNLEEEKIIPEAEEFRNSCGPGAVASALKACKILGACRGELLEYTTSMEVRPREESDSTVGYGSLVWGN